MQAEDGKTTKTYYVVVKLSDEEKPSGAEIYTDTIMLKDANILRDLDILGKNITAGTDSTDIELLLDAGKDTSNLMIYARLSYGATASPALDGKKGMNLSDWTTFTITSGDGTNTRTYRIKATARTQASISAFSLTIGGTVYEGVIDNKANTITMSGVDDSKLSSTSFAPDVTLGPETLVCSPAPGLAQDFSRTVQYIVAGNEKVLSRTYTVSVLNKAGQLISGSGGGGGSDPVTPGHRREDHGLFRAGCGRCHQPERRHHHRNAACRDERDGGSPLRYSDGGRGGQPCARRGGEPYRSGGLHRDAGRGNQPLYRHRDLRAQRFPAALGRAGQQLGCGGSPDQPHQAGLELSAMRKRKTVFLLLACLLLTLAASCGNTPQQPQERSKWDILSAKCGEADCTVSVTKNWGGQETGLSCVVFIPPTEGMDMTAVPLTLQLSEGATLDETEPCIVSIDGMSLVVDLTVSDPCITVQNEGYTRTYCLRLKEAMG